VAILAKNILFATLDPTNRKMKLPGYETHPEVLLTDTDGFVQKLSTQLVPARIINYHAPFFASVYLHLNPVPPRFDVKTKLLL